MLRGYFQNTPKDLTLPSQDPFDPRVLQSLEQEANHLLDQLLLDPDHFMSLEPLPNPLQTEAQHQVGALPMNHEGASTRPALPPPSPSKEDHQETTPILADPH